MYKYELHAHTSECDKVATLGGADLVRLYSNEGYSGIVITDHYFSLFFDWFKDELCCADHKRIIDRYLKGYYCAMNEGEKLGLTVIPGCEVRFDGSINDYLVYGLDEGDFYELPLLNRLSNVEELIKTLPDKAIVVQAHPFRDNMTVCDPAPLFGIEVYNGCTDIFRNKMARLYAQHYGKSMTSGSDVHCEKHLARGGIISERKIDTSADLADVLRCGAYSLIERE